MLNMADVVVDEDFAPPQSFTVLRSTGAWVQGGFQSTTLSIEMNGPVQRASDEEIEMLPEADRAGSVMAFWTTQPIHVTSGSRPLPTVTGPVQLSGSIPGTVYTLPSTAPTGALGLLFKNGVLLRPNVDYTLVGLTVTLAVSTSVGDKLWYEWPTTSFTGAAASDILVYAGVRYRVLHVRHYPGSGYWKALGTQMVSA